MANYPQELAQDAVCQSHTGHMTELWFLPTRPLRLNTNEWILTGDGGFVIIITLVFTHSFPFHSVFQSLLFFQSCPVIPLVPLSVAQGHLHTSRSELPVPNTLKSPNTSTASLIRYSPYKLHTIGDKHHPFLSHLPIFAALVSPWSSGPLTLWSMYNLQTNLLSP